MTFFKFTSGSRAEDLQLINISQPQQKGMSSTEGVPDANVKIIHYLRFQLQEQEAKLSKSQEDGQKLLISNGEKDSTIQMLMEQQADLEAQLVQLQESTSIQKRDLQICKDNLFRLQPVVQLTDSEILKQYETLCQQVSNWVDDEISKFEEKFGNVHDQDAIMDGGSNSAQDFLDNVPQAGEYLLSSVIHTYVQRTFFGEHVVLFGLDPGITRLIRTAKECMLKLQPERDMETINTWHSETLKAMAIIPEIVERRNAMVMDFTTDLHHRLERNFPGLRGDPESKMRLYHDVLTYATQLESSIHLSSTEYRFESMHHALKYSSGSLTVKFLNGIKWVDVETKKTLKPDSLVVADCDGYIGTPLLLFEPSLRRQDKLVGKKTVLRKARILIKLFTPLGRRAR